MAVGALTLIRNPKRLGKQFRISVPLALESPKRLILREFQQQPYVVTSPQFDIVILNEFKGLFQFAELCGMTFTLHQLPT